MINHAVLLCRNTTHTQSQIRNQGPQFELEVISQVCKLLQIDKSRTTPYHPKSNGLIEQFNRTLLQKLANCMDKHPFEWKIMFKPLYGIQHKYSEEYRLLPILPYVWKEGTVTN